MPQVPTGNKSGDGWPEIDTQIEAIEVTDIPREGTIFRLKPNGGAMLTLVIERFDAPHICACGGMLVVVFPESYLLM